MLQILTHPELLAVNQDPLGVQATCIKDCCGRETVLGGNLTPVTCPWFESSWQIWKGPLQGGDFVIIVLNR